MLADCLLLQSSVPGSSSWFLEALRTLRVDPGMKDGAPVEVSALVHLTVRREESPPTP